MDTTETTTPTAPSTDTAPTPSQSPFPASEIVSFLTGQGLTINEVSFTYVNGGANRIDAIDCHYRHGIVDARGNFLEAEIRSCVITFGETADFPGVTMDCNADQLLLMADPAYRDRIVTMVRAQYDAQQAEQKAAQALADAQDAAEQAEIAAQEALHGQKVEI